MMIRHTRRSSQTWIQGSPVSLMNIPMKNTIYGRAAAPRDQWTGPEKFKKLYGPDWTPKTEIKPAFRE